MLCYLKIKIKSLAVEAQIIRREEKRFPGPSAERTGLYLHRIKDVRSEARSALIAYAHLRGRPYAALEDSPGSSPDWKRVAELTIKYGLGKEKNKDVMIKLLRNWSCGLTAAAA